MLSYLPSGLSPAGSSLFAGFKITYTLKKKIVKKLNNYEIHGNTCRRDIKVMFHRKVK